MNYYIKTGLQTIGAAILFLSLVIGITLYKNKETVAYDININRFKQYNDSPLYFHKFIQSSVVYKQKLKYRLEKINE
jgi:hypothetical protein